MTVFESDIVRPRKGSRVKLGADSRFDVGVGLFFVNELLNIEDNENSIEFDFVCSTIDRKLNVIGDLAGNFNFLLIIF